MSDFFERHRAKITTGGPKECWLWTAAKNSVGYGQVGVRGKVRGAHREAYEAVHGEGSAGGLVVRHKCDVRACVNPAHLELGTHADNMRDMVERGRAVTLKGEACKWAKLTDDDVRAIRALYVRGSSDLGLSALALRFGAALSSISYIVNRQRWTHVA